VPKPPGGALPRPSIEFRAPVWEQEVERFDPRSRARIQAERARREIEAGRARLAWRSCEAEGAGGVRLPGCRKLYVPLGTDSPSASPYGFVFRLSQTRDGGLAWIMIAFGIRHPDDRETKSVYARAHKRLHGHYPSSG
jgi:hypothetical protein